MLRLHLWPVFGLLALVAMNLFVIYSQKDDRKLKKYLRIQAIAWITIMSMIVFTGATYMAFYHLDFNLKIILMIAAALALSTLEARRHLRLKRARPGSECFASARRLFARYYLFQLGWLILVGGLTPLIG